MYGQYSTDRNGRILHGSWQEVSGGKGPLLSGSVNNAQDGFLSGYLQISEDRTYTITGGQMAPDNSIAAALDKDGSGVPGFLIIVKVP
jgi:hypothetical protein